MLKNKKAIVIAVAVLAIAVWAIMSVNEKSNYGPNVSLSPSPTATPRPSKTAVPAVTNTSQQSYTSLVAYYGDKRVQFDMNCQAVPSDATFKNDTKILFDNRSGDSRIITIDGMQYSFPGYGYRVITLSSKSLPHIVNLSCGSAVNVGKITIQN